MLWALIKEEMSSHFPLQLQEIAAKVLKKSW